MIKNKFRELFGKLRFVYLSFKSKKKITSRSFGSISRNAKLVSFGGSIEIGERVGIAEGAYLSAVNNGKIILEDNVYINRNFIAASHGEIRIGAGTSIGPGVIIYDHDHRFGSKYEGKGGFKIGSVTIGKNCWLGSGVIVLRGVTIGDGCVIGAGAVVKQNIPDHTLVTSDRKLELTPIV